MSPLGEGLVFLEGTRPHLGDALLFLREHVPTYGKLFYYYREPFIRNWNWLICYLLHELLVVPPFSPSFCCFSGLPTMLQQLFLCFRASRRCFNY